MATFKIIEELCSSGKTRFYVKELRRFLFIEYWVRHDLVLRFGNGASIVQPYCDSLEEAANLIKKLQEEPETYTYKTINLPV